MWSSSPAFRLEFARDEKQKFVDRYGYRKRLVQDFDRDQDALVEFGTVSDRVVRRERAIGTAPGVLPLFLFRHLLTRSVTLHKADLALDLPACTHHKHALVSSGSRRDSYEELVQATRAAIKADRFVEGRAGKLFGALAELGSYLDRATTDTGNRPDGSFVVAYPESCGSELVAAGQSFDPAVISTKERWMLETLEAEIAEGRNCMVLGWHTNVLPRYVRLVEAELGASVAFLEADRVATAKRQSWIDCNVVQKRARVLVVNPMAVQTGLNNLVHFSTQIWMEDPACNPTIVRQAIGRVDRIGARLPTRIHFAFYGGTLQQNAHDLLLRKVAIATAADGLDPESVLIAAGGTEDAYLTGLSLGRELYAMLERGDGPTWDRRGRKLRLRSASTLPPLPSGAP
jgi:hypothetical protein